jgi:hypothetical protein
MAISTRLDASSAKMNSSTVGRRQDTILSIFRATVFGTRIHRYILYIIPDIYTIIVLYLHDIVPDIVYDIILDDIKLTMLFVQDCVCVVALYPFRIEPLEDFDPIGDLDVTEGDDVWYARPLLFFTCTVCPTGHMGDTASHKDVSLVFFNTFEPNSRKLHAEEGHSDAVRKGGFPGAIALCLPSGKRFWTGASDSMLPER